MLSDRAEEIGSDVRLQEDFRVAVAERRSTISGVSMSASGDHQVIFHAAPILDASGRVLGAVRMRSSVAAIEHVVQLAEDRTGAGAMGTAGRQRSGACRQPHARLAAATRHGTRPRRICATCGSWYLG
jgi:hypothetical protein